MLLLSTSSLKGYGLHRIFQFARDAEYTGVDLALNAENYDLWDEQYILGLSREFWVPVLSITAPETGMSSEKLDKILIMAKTLESQLLSFSPPHFKDRDTKWFGAPLAKIKKDMHISICIQNVEPKFKFFVIPEYRNATLGHIKTVTGDTALDILAIDSSSSVDIIKAQKILGSSIRNVFFSDRNGTHRGILPWGAGGGISHLPLESFLMKLKSTWYGGYITLKVEPKEMASGNTQRVLENLKYMKNYYEKHFENFSS